MVLVDTSIWIDHLRESNAELRDQLLANRVFSHPMVIGELACGNLKSRDQILSLLQALPKVEEASHDEVLFCIKRKALMGRGIGFVDVHLLAATLMVPDTQLWTRDKRLHRVAVELGCAYAMS